MSEVTHRHGTFGCLDVSVEDDRLLCCVCGHWFRNLAQHARIAHSLTADEYRAVAGLNRQTKLFSPGLRRRFSEITAPLIARLRAEGKLKRWDEDPERFRETKAAAVETLRQEGIAPEGRGRRRASWTDERRQSQGELTRRRNLSGDLRAPAGAISRGIRAAAGEGVCDLCGVVYQRTGTRQRYCPNCSAIALRTQSRESAQRRRRRLAEGDAAAPRRTDPLAGTVAREATCARCGETFEARSHREKYCHPCREVRQREYWREYAARQRAARRTD
jgi:hypothetical protein